MKIKMLTILLLLIAAQTYGQLNKSIVDTQFPTLVLPYTTQGILTKNGLTNRPINLATDKYLKSDVTAALKFYDKKEFYFEESSKCYSLGKIINGTQIYILYIESVKEKNKNYGYNRCYLVSLNKAYQPLNFFLINEYIDYSVGSNTLYSSRDTYYDFMIKDNLLYATAKDVRTKLKLAQQTTPAVISEVYKYVFDVNGALKDIK
jgi:hypothetical protein